MKIKFRSQILNRPGIFRCLVALILWVSFAQITALAEGESDDSAQPAKTYVSFTGGGGVTGIDESDDKDDQRQWLKSFDIRFGQYFAERWRYDLIHCNEGHPYNHHRDGFSVQATYHLVQRESFRVEVGAGPYLSFDTTRNESGEEFNEKRLGIMATTAFLYYVDWLGKGGHLRAGLNGYIMASRPDALSILLGIGYDIDNTSRTLPVEDKSLFINDVWLSFVHTQVTHGGTQTTAGYSIDVAHRFKNNFALSAGWIDEGGDTTRTDRRGFPIQLWKIIPLGKYFEGRMGLGPYIANDKREDPDAYDVKGIFSFGFNYIPPFFNNEDLYAGISLSRVVDRKGVEDDADLFRLSLGYKF